METLLTIIFALLIVSSVAVYIFARLYKNYKNLYKQEHEKLLGIQEEYSKLVEVYKIKKQNEEIANETIDALHSGKLSADDILPKRKN